MVAFVGRVSWGSGSFCSLAIDDVDSDSWTGTPNPSMTILTAGQPFPWNVRVILLEGPRAGDAADAELHADRAAEDAAFHGRGRFSPAPDEFAVAVERRQILDEFEAEMDPERRRAIFERLHRSLWDEPEAR